MVVKPEVLIPSLLQILPKFAEAFRLLRTGHQFLPSSPAFTLFSWTACLRYRERHAAVINQKGKEWE